MSACADQATAQPATSHFGQGLLNALGPSKLYDVYQRFTYVNHTTQPSVSIRCVSRSHTRPLAGSSIPREVTTLSERFAPDRYQSRTAPRLRAAERSVRLDFTVAKSYGQLLVQLTLHDIRLILE